VPIYEYRCTACGHELEVMQKVNDPAPDPCPQCGAAKTFERLMSRTSFQLKGGGWGSDLYGSAKKPKDAATPAASGGETKAAEPAKKDAPKESAPKDAGSKAPSPAPAAPSSTEGSKK
jgi:putative FmdB family regulatory protein